VLYQNASLVLLCLLYAMGTPRDTVSNCVGEKVRGMVDLAISSEDAVDTLQGVE